MKYTKYIYIYMNLPRSSEVGQYFSDSVKFRGEVGLYIFKYIHI